MTALAPRASAGPALRILFVTPRYFPDMGGIETHVYEVARRLARRAAITVLTTDRTGAHPREALVDGVRILRVPAYPRNRDYYFAPELRAHIRRADYDIVHVQGYHTFVPPLAMWTARREALPYVLTFHSGGSSSGLRNLIRPLQVNVQRQLYAGAARLIGVSKFEAGQFHSWLNLPPERFSVVYNGASLPPVPDDFTPPPDATETILSVGRLEKYKGHHRLIEALPHVLRTRPTARLKVLGVGPYEAELRSLVERHSLDPAVEITHVPSADRTGMARELLSAKLVTLFSEYEAHPVAVMEAVAMSCSILVADTSGLSEVAQMGLARAVPLAASPEQLAQAIIAQLEQPHVPNRINLPTWDNCAEQLFDIYQAVIAEQRG